MKRKKDNNENPILSKKAATFIEHNFPDYNSMKVEVLEPDKVVALLDYGSREPKLRIQIAKTADDYNLYTLIDTQFVY